MAGDGIVARVGFQGELGAFGEEAVLVCFGAGARPVPRREFREVGQAVVEGEVDYGILPIENTLAGSVAASLDVLAALELELVGEVVLPIRHCLLGVSGAELGDVRRVISHPVALAQCTKFLSGREGADAVAVYDTAGAAKEVADRKDPSLAAVAGRRAAARYGLAVLAEEIQDREDNQTRFVVAARPGSPQPRLLIDESRDFRTVLIAETRDEPGALLGLLRPFADRGINLTNLQSRPGVAPWTYRFFLELAGNAAAPPAREALVEARRCAASLRVLGSFASAPSMEAAVGT